MGLPYEDKLQEMIQSEDEDIRDWHLRKIIPDMPEVHPPVRTYHVVFKGEKYTITGCCFIRSIEPFNQELCDLLIQASTKHKALISMVVRDMIDSVQVQLNRGLPVSDWILDDDIEYDDDDEEPAAEG